MVKNSRVYFINIFGKKVKKDKKLTKRETWVWSDSISTGNKFGVKKRKSPTKTRKKFSQNKFKVGNINFRFCYFRFCDHALYFVNEL